MFTNKIEDLASQGFSIKKTRDVQTVIEHAEPFFVKGTAGDIKAPLNEETGTYMVTISGYPVEGQLSESFKRPYLPFLSAINEASVQQIAESIDEAAYNNGKKLVAKPFNELSEGDKFYKSADDSSVVFEKVDEITYKRADNSIGRSLDLYAKETEEVFVVEMSMDDMSFLTQEQKQNIVDHTPKGLEYDDFASHVADEIDNIAGLEMLSDDELSDLIDELFQLYHK